MAKPMMFVQALFLLIILQALPNDAIADLFREFIGVEFKNVKFTDVPVNPQVDFYFLLAFSIDYDTSDSPSPTNGHFNVFWDTDNLDIDYKHFKSDLDTFAEYIGWLISTLKNNGSSLLSRLLHLTTPSVDQFLKHYDEQSLNYDGGKVLVSFINNGSGGLSPADGFFKACDRLKKQGKLQGIFAWSADDSKANRFCYERQSQAVLATTNW
ncbi:unnamed protein product [Linum trigynum]|uniref:Uncharacterized protein n=1 Tax=Linum trigynum TaxID=586398 RepID=A0AAV2FXL8_9ROSI